MLQERLRWLNDPLCRDQDRLEPNSGLGQAFNYLLKHWDLLTLFLRQAGAPLDKEALEHLTRRLPWNCQQPYQPASSGQETAAGSTRLPAALSIPTQTLRVWCKSYCCTRKNSAEFVGEVR